MFLQLFQTFYRDFFHNHSKPQAILVFNINALI